MFKYLNAFYQIIQAFVRLSKILPNYLKSIDKFRLTNTTTCLIRSRYTNQEEEDIMKVLLY